MSFPTFWAFVICVSREEIGHILTFKSNHIHLSTFVQAFHAVWLRDYDSRIETNAAQLLDVMKAMFDRAAAEQERLRKSGDGDTDSMVVDSVAEREDMNVEPVEDAREAEHEEDVMSTILVTCAHMASKDYEKITRSG
jgi:hypothetical protein